MCKSGCCGTLFYAATCPLCRVLVRVVKWLDFAGGIRLQPLQDPVDPYFVRIVVPGLRRLSPGRWAVPEVVAELLHIRGLPGPLEEALARFYDTLLSPAYDVLDRLHGARTAPAPSG